MRLRLRKEAQKRKREIVTCRSVTVTRAVSKVQIPLQVDVRVDVIMILYPLYHLFAK